MTKNQDVEELEVLAHNLAQYYIKGMGAMISGILSNCEIYMLDELSDRKDYVFEELAKIEQRYQQIPFHDFHEQEVYYPLFVVDRLLPGYRKSIETFFDEQTPQNLETLRLKGTSILDVGDLYRFSFETLLAQIHKLHGNRKFSVKVIDPNDEEIEYF